MSKILDTQEALMQAIMANLEPAHPKADIKRPVRPVIESTAADFTAGTVARIKPAMFKPVVIDADADTEQTDESLGDLLETVKATSNQLKAMVNNATPVVNSAVESIIHHKRIRRAKDAKAAYRSIIHALEDLEDAIDLLKHLI